MPWKPSRRELLQSAACMAAQSASQVSRYAVYLILDWDSVAESCGVAFHLNPDRKHPKEPVLLPGEPHQWGSLQMSWPATVLYSAYSTRGYQFRCWYSGVDVIQTSAGDDIKLSAYGSSGRLDRERSQGVYRRVAWSGAPPAGSVQLRLILGEKCRLFSIAP